MSIKKAIKYLDKYNSINEFHIISDELILKIKLYVNQTNLRRDLKRV